MSVDFVWSRRSSPFPPHPRAFAGTTAVDMVVADIVSAPLEEVNRSIHPEREIVAVGRRGGS